jgi:hypothetical protein
VCRKEKDPAKAALLFGATIAAAVVFMTIYSKEGRNLLSGDIISKIRVSFLKLLLHDERISE